MLKKNTKFNIYYKLFQHLKRIDSTFIKTQINIFFFKMDCHIFFSEQGKELWRAGPAAARPRGTSGGARGWWRGEGVGAARGQLRTAVGRRLEAGDGANGGGRGGVMLGFWVGKKIF
jgi:hypothetical protein